MIPFALFSQPGRCSTLYLNSDALMLKPVEKKAPDRKSWLFDFRSPKEFSLFPARPHLHLHLLHLHLHLPRSTLQILFKTVVAQSIFETQVLDSQMNCRRVANHSTADR